MGYTLPGAEENILAAIKIHTMRTDRLGRWVPGREIHHYTGNRHIKDGDYRCFLKNKCKSTQMVLMVAVRDAQGNPGIKVTIDRLRLSDEEVKKLAINDGFKTVEDMMNWFFNKPGVDMWAGKLIHWTNLKY